MDLDGSWLESTLRKNHFEDSPTEVENVEVKVNEQKGDNYMSTVSKIKAKVRLGSGRLKTVALISKDQHTSPHLKEMSVKAGLFFREITMYRDILPKLEDLMSEFGDQEEPLWCQCYDVRLYDRLVLEDLTAKGYAMAKRREQLNFESASLVLRKLGKFHAMTAVLVERSQIPSDLFGKNLWSKMPDGQLHQIIESIFTKAASALGEWNDEWSKYEEKLLQGIPDISKRMRSYLTKGYSEGFQILNHGDCWTNNFLFKWKDGSGTPISMKFVDLQLSYIGKPITDLLWFLGSSVPIEIRQARFEDFIDIYEESLFTNLQKFGYAGKLPAKGEIMKDLKQQLVLLLWFTMNLVPIAMAEEKDAWDFEETMKKHKKATEEGKVGDFQTFTKLGERQKFIVGSVIQEAIENKWFK